MIVEYNIIAVLKTADHGVSQSGTLNIFVDDFHERPVSKVTSQYGKM